MGVPVLDPEKAFLGQDRFDVAVEHGDNSGWLTPEPLEAIAV
jgi:hypothetical protein